MTRKEFEQQLIPLAGTIENYLKSICKDHGLAEDIVQDVYLKLWERRNTINAILDARAYLFKAARNKLIDSGYYGPKKLTFKDELADKESEHDPIHKKLEQQEMVMLLKQLMNELPAIQQEVVHLRDFCGFNNIEVAQIIGESEVYVRVNISRGRKQLKAMMLSNFQINGDEIA